MGGGAPRGIVGNVERAGTVVLVVEDEPDIRLFLREFLSEEGYVVVEAADGAEGLEVAARECPDVVILDLLMPRMTGAEFLERYRAPTWDGPRAPVIMASASSKYLGVSLPDTEAHADKPFDIEQLLALIRRFTDGP